MVILNLLLWRIELIDPSPSMKPIIIEINCSLVNEYELRYNKKPNKIFNVGCFGAIRPMKNHLMQAVAAIEFANRNNLTLRFHVNAGRIESNGNNSIKNVRALFEHLPDNELVEHD